MTPEEHVFLERARVASLATVDDAGRPHAVPICFAFLERSASPESAAANGSVHENSGDGDHTRLVSAIDEKPKSTRELQRVRNIRSNPTVTLLVDRYREDWSRLAWVQVRGRARILEPDIAANHPDASVRFDAVRALESKYDQYADHDLESRPLLSIRVGRTVSWGALGDEAATANEG
ncbi:TIGR03668 family PPOX class F420-dependent oxidoreductase [Natrinema salsiterrestre]|uniref:TIGR03668 family PPOX class F420-dependent oxidoreductase n=1 Tax=Natrinema salsiterrestre TaxID=2950540 RepID=A0A9Q4KX18_9EURY|nr:TIGR03668 family PPOX class F420-dependent oxidoreductase [Natrinema salsiterrestre]MDF9744715.1 TIGR03668 family PPOX class F420-dependent oxidoreductase [Natrinema salsiterrestre]